MRVTLTKPYKKVIFNWDDEGKKYDLVTLGDITDEEVEHLIATKAHEGAEVPGWESVIK